MSSKRLGKGIEALINSNKLNKTNSIDAVKKIISTSVDKSRLDSLFEKNLEEAKSALKKTSS